MKGQVELVDFWDIFYIFCRAVCTI